MQEYTKINTIWKRLGWQTRRRKAARGWNAGPDCAVCGLKAINVIHNTTPEKRTEGEAYYDDFRDRLHEFEVPHADPE